MNSEFVRQLRRIHNQRENLFARKELASTLHDLGWQLRDDCTELAKAGPHGLNHLVVSIDQINDESAWFEEQLKDWQTIHRTWENKVREWKKSNGPMVPEDILTERDEIVKELNCFGDILTEIDEVKGAIFELFIAYFPKTPLSDFAIRDLRRVLPKFNRYRRQFELLQKSKEQSLIDPELQNIKPQITLPQIALIHYYNSSKITRKIGDEIAKKHGHKSGERLFQLYTKYTSRANRIGKEETPTKNANKIKLFEKVINQLEGKAKEVASDELETLKVNINNS